MIRSEKENHIARCLQIIEDKLGWGKAEDWSNYDFSKLSEEVLNKTQVRLSVTTLKRIWGKLKYDNAPALTTLNAVAMFAGYSDWRTYCNEQVLPGTDAVIEKQTPEEIKPLVRKINRYYLLMLLPLIAAALSMLVKTKPKIDPDKFEFWADKMVVEGVPNSVVFHYDAKAATSDSVFIVQTWDSRRKKKVSKLNHEHTAMYYYPGYFRTRLIVDDEVVKRHDLWITSDGWLCLQEEEPIPLYFKKDDFTKSDRIEIDKETLAKYNLSLFPLPPKIRFFNQRDMGDMMSDNFVFETKLKNEFREGTGVCQFVQVLIQCKNDIIIIPLSAKTCIGEMQLSFCGTQVASEDADLSGFGCDLNEWTTLRVETVNKKATIFVNGRIAYSLEFPNDPSGVVGAQYRFNGMGAVKDTWFEYKNNRIQL
ncbi:MAG: hypothetical protein WKF87_04710 [Chryseolinea sp.]